MLVLTCLLTIYFSKLQFKLCNCQPPLTLLLLVEDPARRQTITSSHRPNTSSQIPYSSQHSEAHTNQSNKHNVTEQQETKTHTVKHSSVQIISRSGTTTKTRKPQKLLESLVANPSLVIASTFTDICHILSQISGHVGLNMPFDDLLL